MLLRSQGLGEGVLGSTGSLPSQIIDHIRHIFPLPIDLSWMDLGVERAQELSAN